MRTQHTSKAASVTIAAALLLAACGGSDAPADTGSAANETTAPADSSGEASPATDPATENVATDAALVFYDAAGNTHLDPHQSLSGSSLSQEQLWAVYDRLIGLSDDGDPMPGLATGWIYNDDLTEITLELRDDVTFSDGTPFNAQVVVDNFNRMISLEDQASPPVAATLSKIASFEATDDSTVVFTLVEPDGQMPFWFSQQPGMMVSPAAFADGAIGVDLEPIGSGPYIVENFVSLDTGIYVRNDDYWGGIEGRPATFEHHNISDGQARLNAVQSGQANLSIIDASQIPAAEAAGLEVQINTETSLWNIYVNNGDDRVTGDQRVRQAIMYAIDREALVDNLSFGSGIVTSQLMPPGHPVYIDELADRYAFDQDKARELLADAGYADGMTLDWILLNTSEYRQMGEAIQAMLAEVGIDVVFEIVDISEASIFRDAENPQGDVMMARWGGRPDPLMTFQETTGPTGTYSPMGATASDLIGELIDEASLLEPGAPERLDALRRLNTEIVEQAANIPIMVRSNIFVYQPGCIVGLTPFLAAGDDNMNNVSVAEGC